jgi:hypothetical protein
MLTDDDVDVTDSMDRYRECVRHLWNTSLKPSTSEECSWDAVDQFEALAARIFELMVPPRRTGAWVYRVSPVVRTRIMINRGRETPYWDDPLVSVEPGDLELRLVGVFDWDPLARREYGLYRTEIVGSTRYPSVVNKAALVPVGSAVKVFARREA